MLRPRVNETETSPETPAPTTPADEAETPQELIDRLIRERQDPPPVAPQTRPDVEPIPNRVGLPSSSVDLDPSVVGVLPGSPLPKLRREGEFVIDRSGRLIEADRGAGWVFVFDTVPGQPDLRPMIMQKCQRLASMQEALAQQQRPGHRRPQPSPDPADITFTLTGQVYTYRGVNYLLPTAIASTRNTAPRPDADGTDPAALAGGVAADDAQTPPTFIPSGKPADLMDDLLKERDAPPQRDDGLGTEGTGGAGVGWVEPGGDTRGPVGAPSLAPSLRGIKPAVGGDHSETLRREGEYLVNRAGRLIRGAVLDAPGDTGDTGGTGGAKAGRASTDETPSDDVNALFQNASSGVLFAFEADGKASAAAETPMVVMPCKLLELMEDTVIERGDQVVFVLSGRVFTYRGANHLLPTTMHLQPDLGNLGR